MINLEWYRIFLCTARHGNLTKAAQQLHLTQPSVSYAIKQMERALELKLFHRLSKGVELTEEGKALLAYVEQSFALLDAAEEHVQVLKQLEAGELRIGASDSLIKHLLLPQLNQFRAQYPGIRIRLSRGRTPDIASWLKNGRIDCAIVHMPVLEPQLNVQHLKTLEDCFVVGEAYRELAGRPISIRELAELPLLLLSSGSHTRQFIEHWFAERGCTVEPDIELGSIDLLSEFAMQGFGAAFISRFFVREELHNGRLYELQLDEDLPSRNIGFAVRRDVQLSIAAERFARIVQDYDY